MTQNPSNKPVRVTGQQRPHPALRTLGRACIALARWQRDQQQAPAESGQDASPATTDDAAEPSDTGTGTASPDRERRHD